MCWRECFPMSEGIICTDDTQWMLLAWQVSKIVKSHLTINGLKMSSKTLYSAEGKLHNFHIHARLCKTHITFKHLNGSSILHSFGSTQYSEAHLYQGLILRRYETVYKLQRLFSLLVTQSPSKLDYFYMETHIYVDNHHRIDIALRGPN